MAEDDVQIALDADQMTRAQAATLARDIVKKVAMGATTVDVDALLEVASWIVTGELYEDEDEDTTGDETVPAPAQPWTPAHPWTINMPRGGIRFGGLEVPADGGGVRFDGARVQVTNTAEGTTYTQLDEDEAEEAEPDPEATSPAETW